MKYDKHVKIEISTVVNGYIIKNDDILLVFNDREIAIEKIDELLISSSELVKRIKMETGLH